MPRWTMGILLGLLFAAAGLASPRPLLAQETGSTYVLVVGLNEYQDAKIPWLRFAEQDARAVYAFFATERRSPANADRVARLYGKDATRAGILRAVREHLAGRATRPEDTAVLYFAGHGFADARTSYIAAFDTDVASLPETAISAAALSEAWESIRAQRKVLILDACHAGGVEGVRGIGGIAQAPLSVAAVAGAVNLTIAAAGANELSTEDADLGQGVFTLALLKGLRGEAETNGDGWIDDDELGTYLRAEVPSLAARAQGKQTPVVTRSAAGPAVYLARGPGAPIAKAGPPVAAPPVASPPVASAPVAPPSRPPAPPDLGFIDVKDAPDAMKVAFSPDSRLLAVARSFSFVMVDVSSGRKLYELTDVDSDAFLTALVFAPDSKTLVTIRLFRGGSQFQLRDVASGRVVRAIGADDEPAYSIALSSDGKLLAAAGGRTIRLWNVALGRCERALAGGSYETFLAVAFAPDGRTLVGVGDDCKIYRWDPATGTERGRAAVTERDGVEYAAISTDGGTVAVTTITQKRLRLLRATSAEEIAPSAPIEVGYAQLAFSPDGLTLAMGEEKHGASVWDVRTGARLKSLEKTGRVVAWSPDGKLLATAGTPSIGLRLWRTSR